MKKAKGSEAGFSCLIWELKSCIDYKDYRAIPEFNVRSSVNAFAPLIWIGDCYIICRKRGKVLKMSAKISICLNDSPECLYGSVWKVSGRRNKVLTCLRTHTSKLISIEYAHTSCLYDVFLLSITCQKSQF